MDLDLAIFQLAPNAAYRLNDSNTSILEWRGPGVQPTQQQLTDAWTALQAAQTQKATDASTLRTAVQNQLAGIPGTAWTTLTAAQKQALLIAMLYRLGALDRNLVVQPLSTWL